MLSYQGRARVVLRRGKFAGFGSLPELSSVIDQYTIDDKGWGLRIYPYTVQHYDNARQLSAAVDALPEDSLTADAKAFERGLNSQLLQWIEALKKANVDIRMAIARQSKDAMLTAESRIKTAVNNINHIVEVRYPQEVQYRIDQANRQMKERADAAAAKAAADQAAAEAAVREKEARDRALIEKQKLIASQASTLTAQQVQQQAKAETETALTVLGLDKIVSKAAAKAQGTILGMSPGTAIAAAGIGGFGLWKLAKGGGLIDDKHLKGYRRRKKRRSSRRRR